MKIINYMEIEAANAKRDHFNFIKSFNLFPIFSVCKVFNVDSFAFDEKLFFCDQITIS